jgi:hypothetical protein
MRPNASNLETLCYLCGEDASSDWDYDHVPPRRFYPQSLRRVGRIQLLRLRSHRRCNQTFQRDEDYFFTVLVPLAAAHGSRSAEAAMTDLLRSLRREEGRRLWIAAGLPDSADLSTFKSLDEWNESLSSAEALRTIVVRLDHARLHRVIWKIVRGLGMSAGFQIAENNHHTIELSFGVDESDFDWMCWPGDDLKTFGFRNRGPSQTVWQIRFWGYLVATTSYGRTEGAL